jgi:hypothetical protein
MLLLLPAVCTLLLLLLLLLLLQGQQRFGNNWKGEAPPHTPMPPLHLWRPVAPAAVVLLLLVQWLLHS